MEHRKAQLHDEIKRVRFLILLFVILSALLIVYTTIQFFSQRSKTEKKEKELEIVLNRISDGVVSVDNQWRYTFLNDAAMATHPPGKEETLGKVIWEVHPEMKGTIFWDKYHESMLTKKVVEIESYYAAMNIWFYVKVYPSSDGVTIFYRDVTENKKAEQDIRQLNVELDQKVLDRTAELLESRNQLQQSLERVSFLASIADNIQDPVIATDNDTFITRWNKGAEQLLEWKSEEVIGKNSTAILEGIYPYIDRTHILELLKEKHFWQGEVIYHTKSGRRVNALVTVSDLKDAKGCMAGYLVLIRDITDRKKAEDALSTLNEKLERSNEELEAFSYSVSHDLRAPLRGILGFAAILENEYGTQLDDEARRLIGIIKSNSTRMGQLIDDLLAFSRTGQQALIKTNVDTGAMVTELVNDLTTQNKDDRNIKWEIHPLPPMHADKNTIRQVWINLLSNAVKYSRTREQRVIEVGSYKEKEQTVFFVKDNGVGFDAAYKHKLFKVFQRLHDSKKFEGTGIGLAIVEKIVSRHGGKVWAEANLNEGACFYFSLPLIFY